MRAKNWDGAVFGRLKIIANAKTSSKHRYVKAQCSCGAVKNFRLDALTRGITKSCGCLQRERSSIANTKHGQYREKLYHAWEAMKQRCLNKRHPEYKNYGGRGISVCREWRDSYEKFADWARISGYRENLELDRKENDRGYYPENCRWTTRTCQNLNKRSLKNTSGRVGVAWHKASSKWYVRFRRKHLGSFETFEEAVAVRKAAEDEFWKREGAS